MQKGTQNMIAIVGCGGTGAWAARLMQMQDPDSLLVLIDRDKVERKNLDRQPFKLRDLGKSKARSLARRDDIVVENWLQSVPEENFRGVDWFLCCVDNHPARNATLRLCDSLERPCIIAGNENESAEAYVYKPEWKDTLRDPRVYYHEIVTSSADDPTKPHCSEEQAEGNMQSVTANVLAASYVLRLYKLWSSRVCDLSPETLDHLVFHVRSNLFKTEERIYAKLEQGQAR